METFERIGELVISSKPEYDRIIRSFEGTGFALCLVAQETRIRDSKPETENRYIIMERR